MASHTALKLLHLPLELRLHIYSFCVPNGNITIAASKHDDPDPSSQGLNIAGLPPGQTPVLKPGFHRALLEATEPASELKTTPSLDGHSNDADGLDAWGSWDKRTLDMPPGRAEEVQRAHFSSGKRRKTERNGSSRRSSYSSTISRASKDMEDSQDGGYCIKESTSQPSAFQRSRTSSMVLQESPPEPQYPYRYLPHEALHLACRQTHHELLKYSKININTPVHPRQLDLYLSFPDGVSIAVNRYKNLVRIARTVHVTGVWEFRSMPDPRLVHPSAQPRREGEESVSKRPPGHNGTSDLQINQVNALEHLTHLLLGKNTTQAAERFQKTTHPEYKFPENRTSPEPDSDAKDAVARQFATTFTPALELRLFHPSAPEHHPYREKPPAQKPDYRSDLWMSRRSQQVLSQQGLTKETAIDLDAQPASSPSISTALISMIVPHPSTRPPPRPVPNDTYHMLWTHTLSPGPAALQCIYGGDIKMAVARHVSGNAIRLTGRCNFAKGRYLSMSWPKLEESEGGVRGWLVPKEWGSGDWKRFEDV